MVVYPSVCCLRPGPPLCLVTSLNRPVLIYYEVDEDLEPGRTSIDGVFVAGTAAAARDIPDSILHSDAAAAQAAAYLKQKGNKS